MLWGKSPESTVISFPKRKPRPAVPAICEHNPIIHMAHEYDPMQGKFFRNLTKTNQKIREGRAASIAEDLHMQYKREIENMELDLKRYQRDLSDMLDLHPDSAFGLKVATDFKADEFVTKRLELVVKIRNLKIRHSLAQQDFDLLFATGGGGEDEGLGTGVPNMPIDEIDPLDGEFDPVKDAPVGAAK